MPKTAALQKTSPSSTARPESCTRSVGHVTAQGCGELQAELTFSVLVGVLESLNQAEGLVHRAAHWQVVDGDLPQDALIVDHKQPSARTQNGTAHDRGISVIDYTCGSDNIQNVIKRYRVVCVALNAIKHPGHISKHTT